MATTIVNPQPNTSPDNGMGFLIGIILLIVFLVVLFFYGLPFIQKSLSGVGTQVNIPDHVNVNIQQKGK